MRRILVIVACFCSVYMLPSCKSTEKGRQHRYMKHTFHGIKRSLPEAQVVQLRDTVKVIFPLNLLFDFNSAKLRTESGPSMQRFSAALNKFSKTGIMICGHTDSTGTAEYNNRLSQSRADSTCKVLLDLHVQQDRMRTWGMGSRYPVAPNSTGEGRARNRRVEFIILYTPKNQQPFLQ